MRPIAPSRALVALLALLALPTARAADEPVRLDVKDLLFPEAQWYGIYTQGKKFGWAREWFEKRGDGDKAAWAYGMEGELKVEAFGQKNEMRLFEVVEFDVASPGAMRSARFSMKQQGVEQRTELDRTASGYVGKVVSPGGTREAPVAAVDYTVTDLLTARAWVRSPRKVGDEIRVRDFDVSELEADVTTLTVTALGEGMADGVKVPYYELRMTSAKQGEVGTTRVDTHGTVLSMTFGADLELRHEPEEVAKKTEFSGDLFVAGVVKADRALGGASTEIRRLVMEARGPGAAELKDGPRQQVTKDGDAIVLKLGAAYARDFPATKEEIAENLRETVTYPIRNARLKAMADRAVAGATSDADKVARLVHAVSEFLKDEPVARFCTVEELLDDPRGDCSEHAEMFTAVARAAGFPTREVGGLLYMGDELAAKVGFAAFGGHAWNEVVLDGKWVQVDPAWDQTDIDATHVTLSREPTDSLAQSRTAGGRLSFVVREVEKAPAAPRKETGALPAESRPLLWTVDGPTRIYLFGTIHVGSEEEIGLAPIVKRARDASDVVLGELKLDAEAQVAITGKLFLPAGTKLKDLIPPETYERLVAYLKGKGLSIDVFGRFKVWALAMTLQLLPAMEKAAAHQAIDQVLQDEAEAAKKETGGLETIGEQIEVFDSMPQDQQAAMLDKTLTELGEDGEEGEDNIARLLEIYRSGDLDGFVAAMNAEVDWNDPAQKALMAKLVDDRNVRMVDRLLERAKKEPSKTYFVAVGALHFPGEKGILALLAAKGLVPRRLAATDALPARATEAAPVR